MGVVRPKDTDALVDPVADDAQELLPEIPPMVILKIKRNDVLVFFGRVLGELDRSVGAPPEPLRVFLCIRMVRSALESDIDGDLQAIFPGLG